MESITQVHSTTPEVLIQKLRETIIQLRKENIPDTLINSSWSYIPRDKVLKLLDVSIMTLDEWNRKNILKKRKIGGKVYYKLEEIEAVLEQSIG
ncbi:DNA-binding protein [Flagellimonas sp.]|jgi:hypothetical protein|uniref:DNA-binding protein n=1 Tax=Flagellimonas sp. TaxID=2058762 RepID=UPI003BA94CB2